MGWEIIDEGCDVSQGLCDFDVDGKGKEEEAKDLV